ncbi:MAG: adenylate/guanylate cyclase domain-containing protein [Acidobacteriota bacterium]
MGKQAVAAVGALAAPWVTAAATLAAAAGVAWYATRALGLGVWLPVVVPMLALLLTFLSDLAWMYFVEGREKRRVKRLFSRYVSKDVYQQILASPTEAVLGGQRREMTVLFSDMRGFTTLSESGEAEDLVRQLNQYFTRMVEVVFAHRGTIDKFVGDMVMALYGAPLDDADHADHAVQTALAMVRELQQLNRLWAVEGRAALDIGIGVNTGEMIAGNIGSDTIMSYTVIGDNVNLGARLESLNKDFGTRILISEATRRQLKGSYDIRPLGSVTVKGKTRPVDVFEVRTEGQSEVSA